jgi:WD40 repeat protein
MELPLLVFSPDGKQIVSGSWDKTIRVWDLEADESVSVSFKGHTGRITVLHSLLMENI